MEKGSAMKETFLGRNILVIGGTGTVGRALVEKLMSFQPKVIRIFSRDEFKQFIMREELGDREDLRFLLGDVRDKERLNRAMQGIDIVFNLAALKHVPACEYNPFEAVRTNVVGVQNVIDCAINNNVERVIYTSSDKSISPTNTMGATKLLAERLMSSADYTRGTARTVFASVRFGNVMGSRGSVIPLFKEQMQRSGYITVTDPGMTRFMMSLSHAVELTLQAARIARGGEIFVLKMPVIRLGDLAEVMIEDYCEKCGFPREKVEIRYIGLRPGEKMYEELMTVDEAKLALELDNMYVILPSEVQGKKHVYANCKKAVCRSYGSREAQVIDRAGLYKLLTEENLSWHYRRQAVFN